MGGVFFLAQSPYYDLTTLRTFQINSMQLMEFRWANTACLASLETSKTEQGNSSVSGWVSRDKATSPENFRVRWDL